MRIRKIFSNILGITFGLIFVIIVPLTFVKIITNKGLMTLEYKKKNFPPDKYGFTLKDRIKYGGVFYDYLLMKKNDKDLFNLKDQNENNLCSKREIKHMKDVKKVYRLFNSIRIALTFIFILILMIFILNKSSQKILLSYLFYITNLAISLIILIATFGLFAFNTFFEWFHKYFLAFEENSWIFYESDTLIRLFPIKFWMDMFILLILLTIATYITMSFLTKFLLKKIKN